MMSNFKKENKNDRPKIIDNDVTKIIKRQRKEIMDISVENSKEEYIETFFDMMIMDRIINKKDYVSHSLSQNLAIPSTIYHITHNDSDAIGCSILASLLETIGWNNNRYKTYFCSTNAASDTIREHVLMVDKDGKSLIETDGQYREFKLLLITDINITDDVLEMIEGRGDIIPLMIDHHPTNRHGNVSWCYIKPDDQISATGLFFNLLHRRFKYLLKHPGSPINGNLEMRYFSDYFRVCTPIPDMFNPFTKGLSYIKLLKIVNDISRYDTWEWQKSPSLSRDEDYTTIASKILERDCYYLSKLMLDNLLEGKEALETDVIMHMIERKKKMNRV